MEIKKIERLGSLDVLRGFDLFCLVFFQPLLMSLARAMKVPWMDAVISQFEHVNWEGFTFWDLIMPLFLFMAGASMPFAFAKYLEIGSKKRLWRRILKRVVLLWIFGMMVQGNLLAFDPNKIYLYSNTLQTIAAGYLISAILLMYCNQRWQIILTSALLLVYWALLTFVTIGDYGGGNFTPEYNLAEYIDQAVLGRFRHVSRSDFHYTWVISTLNFGVTVMTGVFAGQIMKGNIPGIKKVQWLATAGGSMVAGGLLWGLQMPVIKHIWTSSMTLFSSGLCFLLMAVFYYSIDYRNGGKYLNWLKIYGKNSILAYMLYNLINFNSVSASLFFGLEKYLGEYYPVLLKLSNVSILLIILQVLYKRKIFLRV